MLYGRSTNKVIYNKIKMISFIIHNFLVVSLVTKWPYIGRSDRLLDGRLCSNLTVKNILLTFQMEQNGTFLEYSKYNHWILHKKLV